MSSDDSLEQIAARLFDDLGLSDLCHVDDEPALVQAFAAVLRQQREAGRAEAQQETLRYFLTTDNDSHWYVVPVAMRAEWETWTEIDSDDERAWTPPSWAKQVGGSPTRITFTDWKNGDV